MTSLKTSLVPETPADLGLPFKEWRPYQREMVERIVSSTKHVFMCELPVGAGKSLIGVASARLMGLRAAYLAYSRQLTQQLHDDFPDAFIMSGRINFPCRRFNFPCLGCERDCQGCQVPIYISADDCSKDDCLVKASCAYERAKRRALSADLAVMPQSYFIHEANFAGSFSGAPFLVVDEAQRVEEVLLDFISVRLTARQLEALSIELPRYKTRFEAWKDWAEETLVKVSRREDELKATFTSQTQKNWPSWREYLRLGRLTSKLDLFLHSVDEHWLFNPGETAWEFKPTWLRGLAQKFLWEHSPKVLALSASFLSPETWAWEMGVDDWDYARAPSNFPKENRPIYYIPCGDMSKNNLEASLPEVVSTLDALMELHPEERGIIHCVTYKERDFILSHSAHKDRLLSHNETDRSKVIEQFFSSTTPAVLVSPSVMEGLDAKYDRAKWQVLTKLCFPDLGDPQIRKRRFSGKLGREWYTIACARKLVQMYGRICRAEDDRGNVTYILDSRFPRFVSEMKEVLPQWFLEAIE